MKGGIFALYALVKKTKIKWLMSQQLLGVHLADNHYLNLRFFSGRRN
jgi:hypothetical protein